MTENKPALDIHEVLKHLPHRYPFLLIDRVVSYESGKSLVALKNVTVNEPFFQGHFPNRPVMPGVLIIEALAQATAILSFVTTETLPDENSVYYFAGIDKARFRRPVEPGDQLSLEVELLRSDAIYGGSKAARWSTARSPPRPICRRSRPILPDWC